MQTSSIDFSGCRELVSDLDGNAQKTRIVYGGEIYIMKYGNALAPDPAKPLQGSCNHAPVSEHVGCRVFGALGVPVQETLIGTFQGREVVACKDFVIPLGPDKTLVHFRSLENALVSSSERSAAPRLDDIRMVCRQHPFLEGWRDKAMARYWETFIGDAIIGNFDRHSGNWGYIAEVDPATRVPERVHSLAPVFDCASSLAARLSEPEMATISADEALLRERALSFPKAKLVVSGTKTIGYRELLLSEEGAEAREALFRLAPAVGRLDAAGIVEAVPGVSDARKEFLKATIRSRIEHVLQPAYDLACDERGIARGRLSDLGRHVEAGRGGRRLPVPDRTAKPRGAASPRSDAADAARRAGGLHDASRGNRGRAR